jgi:hypothetical protein
MSQWTPEWQVTINGGGDYTNLTLSNLTITSGRQDIYSQPYAGYCNVEIINLDLSPIEIDVNDQINIKVKDSTGTFVNLFGGYVTDIDVEVTQASSTAISERIKVVALGALSKLPKTLTEGVLSKDFDGNQIYEILSQALFDTWNEVPAATTWAGYDPTTTWANAENSGLGDIDQPGDYELTARSSNITNIYSLVSSLATSGLGYLYEDSEGRIGYADSSRRRDYLATNGYVDLTGHHALARGIRTSKRSGDVRNNVTITYKANAQESASDAASIAVYGQQAYEITTSLEHDYDALDQAEFYLALRAFPEAQFKSITFPLSNPEIDDTDRDALLEVFMGLPLNITDLPSNITNGQFQGFVEGWTFSAGYNSLYLTLTVSPTAYSIQSTRWNGVSGAETWNTLSPTLEWINATIVA